ncbi:MAG: hypothetical protein ABIW47_16070 [Ginsengibacter sp.]
MKKLIFLIATMAYMFSTTGATVYIHHCMGKVIDWDFTKNDIQSCGTCSMEKDTGNDCCKDEVKVFKIDNVAKHPEASNNQLSFKDIILPVTYFALIHQYFSPTKKEFFPENIVLNEIVPDLCILHCTYLI